MRLHPSHPHSLWLRPSRRLTTTSIRFQRSSSSSSSSSSSPLPTTPPPRSRSHRRRPPQPLETRQVQLPIDSLGEPGSVTVISSSRPKSFSRNRKTRPAHKFHVSDRDLTGEPQSVLDTILDDLDEEVSTQTSSDIHDVIENLRPSDQSIKLAPRDWESLRSTISTSFTHKQLSDYISVRKQTVPGDESKDDAWRPGTSSFWDTNSSGNGSYTTQAATSHGLTGKLLLAEHILRVCWKLSIVNEIGQLDIRLSPMYMTVLLNSTHFSFDEVAELHASNIDVTSSLGLVRMTGEHEACESMRDVIQEAVARIREADAAISLENITTSPSSVFTRVFIDWVCQTYSVAIEQDSSSVPVKILFLAESMRDAEDARRTLNLALSEASQTPAPFSTYMPASEPANLYVQTLQYPSWLERSKMWFRWALSSAQTTSTEAQRTPFFDGHQTRLSDELLKLLRKDPETVKRHSSSGVTLYESVTAAVGRCLFSSKQTLADTDTAINATQLGRSSMTRTFTTEVPSLTPFLESLSQPKTTEEKPNLRLKPTSKFQGIVPELEIEYILHNTDGREKSGPAIEITSLKSILETSSVDYLLPENSVDLRFTRTVHRSITTEMLDESPQYRQLIRNLELSLHRDLTSTFLSSNPSHSAPLPPFCKISLPRGLLLSPQEEKFSDSVWDPLLQNNLDVEYIYPPLHDIRGAIAQYYDIDGRELRYRFYESGPFLAGRRTEVALSVDIPQFDTKRHPDADGFQRAVEHHYHFFYNAACDMAFKVKSKSVNQEVDV
ncbi:hypothetical protein PENSTE_c003G04394 [Penicillium steckii]|uniref:Uncharacterized protein n=1 Tax=Penicillium steckii TaxID=303698 RepID=A0A1V6TQY6_9EURO|nr:hypothetical protein PENSTE_c003G04394 [Penicillium steckii]